MKISVAMATYNGEKYISEQLKSILSQLENNDEIIISDDESTDMTINIIQNIKDSRIKIIKGPQKGLIKNFENACKFCSGDIIFLSDQDDIWDKNRVSEVRNEFLNGADVVISRSISVDEHLNKITKKYMDPGFKFGYINNILRNTYIGAAMAIRREFVNDVIPFPESVVMHDQWIGLCAELKNKKIIYNDASIIYHRRLDTSISFNTKQTFLKKINDRVTMIYLTVKHVKM